MIRLISNMMKSLDLWDITVPHYKCGKKPYKSLNKWQITLNEVQWIDPFEPKLKIYRPKSGRTKNS